MFKKLALCCLALIFMLPVFTGCNQSKSNQWLTGTDEPNVTLGVDGDFYLDSDDFLLYKKENGQWVFMGSLKGDEGEPGTNGDTPTIGSNGNWWINGTDTGYSALGKDGKTPTIEINENGFWVINGEITDFSAEITSDQLYEKLSPIIEYDSVGMTVKYKSAESENFDLAQNWHHTTGDFSGWAGSIGRPSNIECIKFKVRARDTAITKIGVFLAKSDKNGETLAQQTLEIEVAPYNTKDIIWVLDEPITNEEKSNIYFGFACNQLCDIFGRLGLSATIPENEEQVLMSYAAYGTIPTSLSRFEFPVSSDLTSYYSYIPVEIGEYYPIFRLSDSAIEDIMKNLNLNDKIYQNTALALPETIYGYANQTLKIYFENISAYSLKDVYFDVSATKGNIYSDRWEYTPTSAENFEIEISIYNRDYQLLSKSTHNVVIKDLPTKSSANVLVIGDSTVNAGTETQTMLDLDSSDETFDLTLLGTRGTGENKHEGRGGWTAYSYVNLAQDSTSTYTNSFYNPEKESFDFSYYMATQDYADLDVVFLQLGINDMFASKTDEQVASAINIFTENLEIMISSIHEYDPEVKIVINLIIPCQLDQNKFTQAYGTRQTVWACKRNTYKANLKLIENYVSRENVYLSWFNATIDAYDEIGNDVHPNAEGYAALGNQMYNFLKSIL